MNRFKWLLISKIAYLLAIQPGGNARIFAHTPNTRGVPVIHLPNLDPLLRRAGKLAIMLLGFAHFCTGDLYQLTVLPHTIDVKGAAIEATCALAVNVAHITIIVVVHHHLETLPTIIAA